MNAVATIEEQEARQLSPQKAVRREIEAMADQFKMALPSHIKVDKFQRVVLTAIMADPDLLHADRRSLIGAVTRAAQDGLLPDKREGALVIFNQKVSKKGEQDRWIQAVQWMPMIAGVLKKVRQSGEISAITANIIHDKDRFVWSMGDEEAIEHVPPQLGQDRGSAIGVYAIATLKDGYKIREVMDIHEIEKVRKVSKTGQYGPWKDWWEEMAKKTVIRRLSKRLPMSTDIEGVINDEATDADFSRSAIGALGDAPQRITRAALADHANYNQAEITEIDQSEQPPAVSSASQQEDESRVADGSQEEADAGAASDTDETPVYQAMIDGWKARLAAPHTVTDISSIRSEFDKNAWGLPDEVNAEIDGLLTEAAYKFTQGE